MAVLLCWVLFPTGDLLQKGKSRRAGNLREAEVVSVWDERQEQQASAAHGWLLGGPVLVFLSVMGPCTHPKSSSAPLLQSTALGTA